MALRTVIFWFRNDLRLADNLALREACAQADRLLLVFVHDSGEDQPTPWGFVRRGPHRRAFQATALAALDEALRARGSRLLQCAGAPAEVLVELVRRIGADTVVCEDIPAPEEQAAVDALRAAGLRVETVWQSSLLDPATLPFEPSRLPPVFTAFRQVVEAAGCAPADPLPAPVVLPPLPPGFEEIVGDSATPGEHQSAPSGLSGLSAAQAAQASFPYWTPAFEGGEPAAQAHLQGYFAGDLAHRYKATRNGLIGADFSSKFSPWLAQGALSPRSIYAALRAFEARRGASEGSYWLWFELLWRDYFRFLHLQHGRRLYRASGLAEHAVPPAHDAAAFARWCRGETGQPLVDAGMRELAATGYLSNRLRQVVASYLVHDLGCDWRAGAAWFEAQLVDFDVCSNQGNWLYIAGRGCDPRGGRRFNPDKQAQEHDPDGVYRRLWGCETGA